ncbi:histone deacetylase 4-like isoform X3 [Daphnia pulicaria]|nr:histone deacetylase 4-like isoform X3 [Daphnia pulicaria]XP_046651454.1 histone deacetylase 4-like isoform X3 [Daphnia pulicaria]XP_046651455.1 histone deacetylase 4-like isoform X3 [Daphnia pulicaria]XP_046651456.1 histone deacetylase 4-like isoform X3 [Daphnia pulicaria]
MNSASPLSSSFVTSHRRPEMVVGPVVGSSSSGSSVSSAVTSASPAANNNNNLPSYREQAEIHHQIMQLKQQQQLQQQVLLQRYQAQQQQLAHQHEQQMQEFLEQKKKAEEEARLERERHEKERLLALKNKEKREQSAVASSEVKQRLQEFVLNKKQREAAAAAAAAGNGTANAPSSSSAPYRAWTGAVPTLPASHGCSNNKGSTSQLSSGLGSSGSGNSSNGVGGNSSSCSSSSSSGIVHPHPYRHPLLSGNFDDDFPLRKTASEPNLLKMRYKHRGTVERRNCSPLVARRRGGVPHHHLSAGSGPVLPGHHHLPPPPPLHHRQAPPPAHSSSVALAAKRMSQLTSQDTGGSTPESPSGAGSPLGSHHPSSGVVPEEISPSQYHLMASHGQGSISDLTLYSSPSLPNISLGRPAIASHHAAEPPGLAMVSEVVDMRAAFSVRMGLPATGAGHHPLYQQPQPQHHPHAHPLHQHHHLLMPSGPPFFPPPPLDSGGGDYVSSGGSPESPGYIQKQMQLLEQAGHHTQILMSGLYNGAPITDAQVAQARLNKSGMRPLGRTQSAPLPLGHPLLQGAPHGVMPTVPLTQQQFDQYVRERHIYEQQHQHNLLKQQIRQTVLTRAGSRSQVENVEEETEAAVAREMSRDRERGAPLPEVIDLTEHKLEEEAEADRHSSRDGLSPLQLRVSSTRSSLQASPGSAFVPRGHHVARPLSRAFSSPLVSLDPPGAGPSGAGESGGAVVPMTLAAAGWGPSAGGAKTGSTSTALAYDGLMLRHQCMCGSNSAHPEHGGRLQSIWARLQETGAVHRCLRLRSRKATAEELQSVHSDVYTMLFGTEPMHRPKVDVNRFAELPMKNFVMLPCGGIGVDSDTTWNDIHTPSAARMAAGCVIDLAFKAAMGEIRNGFAIVRPPGHHAEAQQAMGFCFFNSVAIAAKQLRLRHKLERILIVDWDVHHGNGTQQIFYEDPHILYISIHRHDDGHFFPGTGNPLECGSEDGIGFNVNIAWSGGLNPPLGDAEYLAAFRALVMPIAQDFDPEIVLVSAGFDAATGHPSPLGGYQVSAACFGYMTRQLMELAGGKLVMALEGGYDLPAICDASHECVRALLGDEPVPIREEELARRPCQNAIDSLHKVISIQQPHWPIIKRYAFSVSLSAYEVEGVGRSRSFSGGNGAGSLEGGEDSETLSAMAGLSVCRTDSSKSIASSSRELSQEPMDQDESK